MGRTLQPGDVLKDGRYEIQQFLGRGQEKEIYRACDRDLDCLVALDVFSGSNPVMPGGRTLSAWEARVLGHLGDHPNIATVLDRWNEGDTAFMTTRYLSGGSLKELIADSRKSGGSLSADQILQISAEIANGLAHIHACGILYLDLQPKNVRFDQWQKTRLVDFDTAVPIDDTGAVDVSERRISAYTAPELLDGGLVEQRADLYSLGATVYEMCQGYPPGSSVPAGTEARLHRVPLSPCDRDDLPQALTDLVESLLSPSPEDRPPSTAEVLERLELIRAGKPSAALRAGDSQPFPRPDPAELRAPASARATAASYAVGDVIDDRFEILEIIDQGGFAKVYRVSDDLEGEERALKLFNSALGYDAVRRELRALRRIRHPHVVEVFWANKSGAGEWYLITEFIHGERLDEFVGGTRCMRDREAVDVALDLLDALVAFHPDSVRLAELDAKRRQGDLSEAEFHEWRELSEHGLVHRDIKPRNVILTRGGAKLLDFNIASRVGDPVLTQSGTPPYQPPDADLTRWEVTPDLFAVGVILYELLCDGQHPYPNARPMVDEPVIDPRKVRPDLRPDLADFLVMACAPAKADRYPTAAEMRDALREIRAEM
jgi:serine/threonine protein kinase